MENAYLVLGLDQGPAATEDEIRKAYRRQALLKHPDKNRDNPDAADEFAALQRAYDVLADAEARAALDALLRAKEQREERRVERDEKRQRMVEELERREAEASRARAEAASTAATLQREMERLRRVAAEKAMAATAAAEARRKESMERVAEEGPSTDADDAVLQDRLARTLKVSWASKERDYSPQDLRDAFERFSPVEDVILRGSGKSKGRAYVVLASVEAVRAASGSACGDLGSPLLVMPLLKVGNAAASAGTRSERSSAEAAASAVPSWAKNVPSLEGSGDGKRFVFPCAASMRLPFSPGGASLPAMPAFGSARARAAPARPPKPI